MAKRGQRRSSLDDALEDQIHAERIDSLSGPDSPEGRELAKAVGANVTLYRSKRGLDLAALSVRSGLTLEFTSAIEAGQAVPSLRALWHLATALQVPFGELLKDTVLSSASDPDFRLQPSDRGRVISSATNEFRSRVLFLEGDPRTPEVYELTLEPGCFEEATPHAAETYEHIAVVKGSMIVRAAERTARLGPGDTIFFRADVPHSYENPGPGEAIAHLVMSYASTPE